MKYILILSLLTVIGSTNILGQTVNSINILPSNATSTHDISVVSDFSYFGNCNVGLVNYLASEFNFVINIYPEYCGYGDTTLCNSIDTFSIGVLPAGTYTVNLEYSQGTVCGGSFNTIIATYSTTFEIGSLGIIEPYSNEKKVVKIVDVMGREVDIQPNSVIIYLFEDGSSERVLIGE